MRLGLLLCLLCLPLTPAWAVSGVRARFISAHPELGRDLVLADVPTHACATGGQIDQAPPKLPATIRLRVPKSSVGRIGFYRGAWRQGLIAPSTWECRATGGSDGVFLLVAPPGTPFGDATDLKGPALVLHLFEGGTSGRFEVAAIGARVFPILRPFGERVKAEGIDTTLGAPAPWPADTLDRLSDRVVTYVTAAQASGLGTQGPVGPGALPVEGFASVRGALSSPELIVLSARLPPEDRDLYPIIALLALADSAP